MIDCQKFIKIIGFFVLGTISLLSAACGGGGGGGGGGDDNPFPETLTGCKLKLYYNSDEKPYWTFSFSSATGVTCAYTPYYTTNYRDGAATYTWNRSSRVLTLTYLYFDCNSSGEIIRTERLKWTGTLEATNTTSTTITANYKATMTCTSKTNTHFPTSGSHTHKTVLTLPATNSSTSSGTTTGGETETTDWAPETGELIGVSFKSSSESFSISKTDRFAPPDPYTSGSLSYTKTGPNTGRIYLKNLYCEEGSSVMTREASGKITFTSKTSCIIDGTHSDEVYYPYSQTRKYYQSAWGGSYTLTWME